MVNSSYQQNPNYSVAEMGIEDGIYTTDQLYRTSTVKLEVINGEEHI
jgi:hypothetical protein